MRLMSKTELAAHFGCTRTDKQKGTVINSYKFRKFFMTDKVIKDTMDLDMTDPSQRKTYNSIRLIPLDKLRRIKAQFPSYFAALFLLLLVSSCDTTVEDQAFYIFPTETPEDPMSTITDGKVHLGRGFFEGDIGKAISLTGMVNCSNCHTDDTAGGSPDLNFPGGIGEGASLVETEQGLRYVLWDDYHGITDSMTWPNSRSYSHLAFQEDGGLSRRFGNYLTYDEYIAHFQPDTTELPPRFIRDTLINCHDGIGQAMAALFGHNQISIRRIEQRPDIIDTINLYLETSHTIQTPLYQIAWSIACSLDAFQRTKGYRNNTRSQQLLRGDTQWSSEEWIGFMTMKTYCTSAVINGHDYSCHHKPDWSGDMAPSVFPNLPGVPDAINDVSTKDIIDITQVYRKVPGLYYTDTKLWGPHGTYEDDYLFLLDHIGGMLMKGDTKMEDLDTDEIRAVQAYIECL